MQKKTSDRKENAFAWRYFDSTEKAKSIHTNTAYAIFLPVAEALSLSVNGEKIMMRENMLLFLRPGDTCFVLREGKKEGRYIGLMVQAEGVEALFTYLGVHGTALGRKLLESPMPPVRILTDREKQSIRQGIGQFNLAESEAEEPLYLAFRFFLAEVLRALAKPMPEKEESDVPAWLERACIQMEKKENFMEGLPRMIVLSGKTREHLARSMQKYKNSTTSAFINNLRLEYAAKELATSQKCIIDLCFESGFTSLDYFGKLFKKKYGMSPTAFRKHLQYET